MDRALIGIGFAWLVVFGSFESGATWKRYAFEIPGLDAKEGFKMLEGGHSW